MFQIESFSFRVRLLYCIVLYCIVLYLFAQNHIDNFHVKNEIQAVSGMCQEQTGCHNENTDACPEIMKRLYNGYKFC